MNVSGHPRDRVGLGFELPSAAHKGLVDYIARQSLDGRQVTVDEVVEGIILDALDAAEGPAIDAAPVTVEDQPAPAAHPSRRLRAKAGALAAVAAHKEGLTYREAAERFGVSHETVGENYRRLYPNERRTKAGPPREPPTLAQVEAEHIASVLNDCNGNVSESARVLGIQRSTLQRKIERDPTAYQPEPANDPIKMAAEPSVEVESKSTLEALSERYGHLSTEGIYPTDAIAVAAELRERIDALAIERKDWERLRAELDDRIGRNIAETIIAQRQLDAARRAR